MKISFARSGGVEGSRLVMTVDTTTLDPESASRLHKLVTSADLGRLSEPTLTVRPDPGTFRCALTVEDGTRTHCVIFDERRVPEALKPLIEAVRESVEARKT